LVITKRPGKEACALARVTLDAIDTRCVVHTHVSLTVVNVDVTRLARKAWFTLTRERQQGVGARTVHTRVRLTVIHL